MPLVLKDRVRETTTTTGTGSITLAGAVAGFQSFSAIGDGNTTYYAIVDKTNNTWETGVGLVSTSGGTTLARVQITDSSNSGAVVDFASGTKDVFVTASASLLDLNYWVGVTYGEANADIYDICVATNGDLFSLGQSNTGAGGLHIARYSKSGVILWQRTLIDATLTNPVSIARNTQNDVYVSGTHAPTGNMHSIIAKYNASGTLQWQRYLSKTNEEAALMDIAVSAAGDVYGCGFESAAGTGRNAFLIKFNSSGTLQWQKLLTASSTDMAYSVDTSSSGDIYVAGLTTAPTDNFFIAKYNASGVLQWTKTLFSGAGYSEGDYTTVRVGLSGNVYAVFSGGANSDICHVVKFNSSGDLLWQRRAFSPNLPVPSETALDAEENIYVGGYQEDPDDTVNFYYEAFIFKYDKNGNFLYSRRFNSSIDGEEAYAIAVDNSGGVISGGVSYSTTIGFVRGYISRFPSDGSLLGPAGPFNYNEANFTDSAGTLSINPASFTDGTAGVTVTTPTFTDAAGAVTNRLIRLE